MSLIKKVLGEEVVGEVKQEQEKREEELEKAEKKPKVSILWYFLPFLFGFVGGLIGWALLRERDKGKAGQLFLIGVFMTGIMILFEIFK